MNRVQSQTEVGNVGEAPLPSLLLVERESVVTNDSPDTVRLFYTQPRDVQSRGTWSEVWSEVEAETPGAIVFQSNPLSD